MDQDLIDRISLDGSRVSLDGSTAHLDGSTAHLDGSKVSLDGSKVGMDGSRGTLTDFDGRLEVTWMMLGRWSGVYDENLLPRADMYDTQDYFDSKA